RADPADQALRVIAEWASIHGDTGSRMKTTQGISSPLFKRAKKLAARMGATLRSLVEAGLRHELQRLENDKAQPFTLPDARVGGRGLRPEFRDAGWEKFREAAYGGRGEAP